MGLFNQVKTIPKNPGISLSHSTSAVIQKGVPAQKQKSSPVSLVLNIKGQQANCLPSSNNRIPLTPFHPMEAFSACLSSLSENHPVLGQLKQMGESVAEIIQASASLLLPVVNGISERAECERWVTIRNSLLQFNIPNNLSYDLLSIKTINRKDWNKMLKKVEEMNPYYPASPDIECSQRRGQQ